MKPLEAAAILLVAAAPAAPAPVTGRWTTADAKAEVVIAPCGKALCGRIARVLNPVPGQPTADARNPDASKRSRPIQGMTILNGFVASGETWTGQIYDPKTGKTYTSYLSIEGVRLKVQGCIGPLCQTQYWTRTR